MKKKERKKERKQKRIQKNKTSSGQILHFKGPETGRCKTLLKPSLPIQSTAEAVSHHFSDSLVLKNLGRITSGSNENKIILYDYEG